MIRTPLFIALFIAGRSGCRVQLSRDHLARRAELPLSRNPLGCLHGMGSAGRRFGSARLGRRDEAPAVLRPRPAHAQAFLSRLRPAVAERYRPTLSAAQRPPAALGAGIGADEPVVIKRIDIR